MILVYRCVLAAIILAALSTGTANASSLSGLKSDYHQLVVDVSTGGAPYRPAEVKSFMRRLDNLEDRFRRACPKGEADTVMDDYRTLVSEIATGTTDPYTAEQKQAHIDRSKSIGQDFPRACER